MYTKVSLPMFVIVASVAVTACASRQPSPTAETNIANPASVYCEQNGGTLEIRKDASGGEAGVCVFSDGSECDEWAYFHEQCKPGDSYSTAEPVTSPAATVPARTQAVQSASEGWKIYQDAELDFSFEYPAEAEISRADDPLKTLSIIGPSVNDNNWPMIYFNHPTDREDYRPPEGVDLPQWLTDHNLLVGERLPDTQIAGVPAVHTRFDRSQQSYAYDTFFFARDQQLYSVVLLHTGDKEDWELYDHFLNSIQFSD